MHQTDILHQIIPLIDKDIRKTAADFVCSLNASYHHLQDHVKTKIFFLTGPVVNLSPVSGTRAIVCIILKQHV